MSEKEQLVLELQKQTEKVKKEIEDLKIEIQAKRMLLDNLLEELSEEEE